MNTSSLISTAIALSVVTFSPFAAKAETDERRLSTVYVKTVPPHKGELHINPTIIRDVGFERPGYTDAELVFVPVETVEGVAVPLDGKDSQDRFKITASLPPREAGTPFTDTPRDYRTQDVILPKGAYALTEISFLREDTQERVSYCLNDGSFAFDVLGGDIIFMGLLDLDYPPNTGKAQHKPAADMLSTIEQLNGWRKTWTDLARFEARRVTFNRDERVCKSASY